MVGDHRSYQDHQADDLQDGQHLREAPHAAALAGLEDIRFRLFGSGLLRIGEWLLVDSAFPLLRHGFASGQW